MDRRTFLKATSAAAATTAAAGTARGQAVLRDGAAGDRVLAAPAIVIRSIKIDIVVPSGSAYMCDAADELTRDIAVATDARIAMRVVADDAVAGGDGDGSAMAAVGAGGGAYGGLAEACGAPELALFTGLPAGVSVSPDDLFAWHETAGGQMFLDEAMAGFGLKALIGGHSGAGPGLWSNAEIVSVADLCRAKIRATGLGRDLALRLAAAAVGGDGTGLRPHPELQVTELPLPPHHAMLELAAERRRFWYAGGLHADGQAAALMLPLGVWQRLGDSDQSLIEALAMRHARRQLARARVAERMMAPALYHQQGRVRGALPAEIVRALRAVAVDVVHDALGEPVMARALSAYEAFREAMTGLRLPRRGPGQAASGGALS